ncbi:MAG: LacI family DNA-binding transcriptional regulator [bacterium]
MSITIKDVARLAGVSVATVSRVINDSAPVLAGTRDRVLAAADRLRFSPNGAARSLSMQRTLAIGVILPDLYGEFFSELLRGIDQAAQRAGYSLLVSSSHHDARGIEAAVRVIRGRIDGLLVMAPEVTRSALAHALPRDVPTVLLNGRAAGSDAAHAITVDNYGGATAMTRHLLSLRHRRIGFIAGAVHNADAQARERGHRAALRTAGAASDPALVVRGDFTERGGVSGARALVSLASPPTAIFAANDAMAVGALAFLREVGIDVPRRMTVVGFDDIPVARFLNPPLTSVRVGIAALGARGTQVLLDALVAPASRSSRAATSRRDVLPTELVVRGSSGAASSSARLFLAKPQGESLYGQE